jgi:glycosyltransferase involved in cell wall biosynthesis
LKVYCPINRDLARKALGIEAQGPVVLVAAEDLTERRKGGALLADIFRAIRRRPLTVVTLGNGRLTLPFDGIAVYPLGYIDHERTKVLAYNAADLLLHPAPVDNLPNVVMEAISCGTPCAAFAVGGLPDMVRTHMSGWLARDVSPLSLANVVDEGLDAISNGIDLRDSCRKLAEDEYDARSQSQRYLELFKDVRRRGEVSRLTFNHAT